MTETNSVFDVDPQSFQNDVIERSKQMPVLLLFWAQQVGPSVETRNTLATLAGQFQGKILLGLVDVARDQTLAQHLRVQGLPSIRVVRDGQLIDQLDGPQPESVLREMVEQLTLSPAEMLKDQLALMIEGGELDAAVQLLQQAVNEEPNNFAFRVELADVLIMKGALEDARSVLAGIPADTEDRDRPENRLAFVEEAQGLEDAGKLRASVEAAPEDLDARYQLAVVLTASREYEGALDQCMSILQQDRNFRDDLGRTTMIRIFTLLGKGSELATAYRRRMFNFMH
jgi:putative thioredoxin